jgi:energy-coupling factor transporter ATP-binding protein EcfA2
MPQFNLCFNKPEITLSSGYTFNVVGSLSFDPGDCILVLGENGSGKTTFLTLLQSLFEAEARGSILKIDWNRITQLPPKSRVAHVFQEPRENFISRCSADEIILPFLSTDFSADEILNRLSRLVDAADVYRQNNLRSPIDLLSAGEQQRVAICAALAPAPAIMLWDEALARIDDRTASQFDTLMDKSTLRDTVLLAATHRPQRFSRLFAKRITSVISLKKIDHTISVTQQPYVDGMRFPGQITDDEINFCSRVLWQTFVNKDLLAPDILFFNNGFRIFGSKLDPLLKLQDFEVLARDLPRPLATLREGVVTERLNFVVGRNGSGKTLFLRFMAGHFPINPMFRSLYKVFISTNFSDDSFGLPPEIRQAGLSVYLPGEPFRWLTEESISDELLRYHDGDTLTRRLGILERYRINANVNPEYLSYGERKLVCLMSLPEHLDLVCLDEPFADMSITLIKEMEDFIGSMVTSGKWRSVLISHASDLA